MAAYVGTKRYPGIWIGAVVACVAAVALSCESDDIEPVDDGAGKGEKCASASACATTLVCAGDGVCKDPGQAGTTGPGQGCASNADCLYHLVCASDLKCRPPGKGGAGDACKGNESCKRELVCSSGLKCAKPGGSGAKTAGTACNAQKECALGLVCVDGKCGALSYWAGVKCATDVGPARPYFELPRDGKKLSDFYRLPFPNNVRMKGGKVDVSDHPNPGTALPKSFGDVVGSYYKQIGKELDGFGVNQGIFVRFSKQVNFNTLTLKDEKRTVRLVDIDKKSPNYGHNVGMLLGASTARNKYICQNWMVIRPSRPLRASTTYALILNNGIKDIDGKPLIADNDFKVMLSGNTPSDATVKSAWDAYKPLRAFVVDKKLDSSKLVGGTVFTTRAIRGRMSKFRPAIHARPAPTLSKLTLCDGNNTSPCDTGGDSSRGCPSAPDSDFYELHAIYSTPVFQKGTPPYKTMADGGNITYDGNGQPIVQRDDKVCVVLAVPKGTPPADGWPIVIHAHGTGGSLRTYIQNGTAGRLAGSKSFPELPDKTPKPLPKLAGAGIDGSMHGPRAKTKEKPDRLFFNVRNPLSARDNVYQGAADKFQLVRLLASVNVSAALSPTKRAIKFDPKKIYYFGHSQGTIEGVPFLAYEPNVKATVLSGAGGYLIGAFLKKTKPLNVAGIVKLALADGKLTRAHPLLNILQMYFDEVDTLNYGRSLVDPRNSSGGSKHTLLGYGAKDSYTPPTTIDSLGLTMQLKQVTLCGDTVCAADTIEDCNKCSADCPTNKCSVDTTLFGQTSPPVSGNAAGTGGKLTAGIVEYTSHDKSYDDHFVLFKHPQGREQPVIFLRTAARSGVPTIPSNKTIKSVAGTQ